MLLSASCSVRTIVHPNQVCLLQVHVDGSALQPVVPRANDGAPQRHKETDSDSNSDTNTAHATQTQTLGQHKQLLGYFAGINVVFWLNVRRIRDPLLLPWTATNAVAEDRQSSRPEL